MTAKRSRETTSTLSPAPKPAKPAKAAKAAKPAKAAKAPRVPKPPKPSKPSKPVELQVPPPVEGIDRWLVVGLDPSLSRTGFAVMLVDRATSGDRSTARWLDVGSIKPEDASDPVWVRSKAVALAVASKLREVVAGAAVSEADVPLDRTGLIVSFEAPTPGNDFLTSISRILHLVMFDEASVADRFRRVHVQMTNASTLRRLMGLTLKGASNKKENVARAYTFLDQGTYPNLDTDACDAVLMGMMARYAAAVLMGYPDTIPERFLVQLANSEVEVVGKGSHQRTRTKGTFFRPEYWSLYKRREYAVLWRDARVKKSRLERQSFVI